MKTLPMNAALWGVYLSVLPLQGTQELPETVYTTNNFLGIT